MGDDPELGASQRSALWDAKFQVPSLRSGMVSRAALVDRLRTQPGRPVVVVSAPAGYGKTTLLAEWAELDERCVGWVSLDRRDNDPVVLLTAVATAIAGFSRAAAGLVGEMSAPGPVLQWAAPRLASALRDSLQPFVLMLDDVHRLTDPMAIDVIDLLISQIPPGSTVATAGRTELDFVARRRARAEALEVTSTDLVLDAAAVAKVFRATGITLGHDLALEVVRHTEGWPAGVYLSALIARQVPDAWTAPLPIRGDDRFIADFLSREALASVEKPVRDFLLQSAVLDEFCGPLCEAVLGVAGADRTLRALERANFFLVPLDRHRGWYRYHSLFREMLLDKLREEDAALIPVIQRRAAVWHETNGSPERAVDYLLTLGDVQHLGPLLATVLRPNYMQGRLATIDRWLSDCKPEVVEHYPPLAVLAGWTAALSGRPASAEQWAATAAGLSFEERPGDGSASFASAAAMLRALLCARGVSEMNRDAELAVELEPIWSPWRDTALWLLGEARLLAGEADEAVRLFDEALQLGTDGTRPPILIAFASCALVDMDEGNWTSAEARIKGGVALAESVGIGDYLTGAMAHAAAARLALHAGAIDRLHEHLPRAMRSRSLATYAVPHAAVRLRLILTNLHAALGDGSTARVLLNEITAILSRRPDLGTLVTDVKRATEAVDALPVGPGQGALTAAELRVVPYLQTHLTFAEIADRLYVSRSTVNSQAGSIYRKLGVSSRGAAVDRARQVGVVGG